MAPGRVLAPISESVPYQWLLSSLAPQGLHGFLILVDPTPLAHLGTSSKDQPALCPSSSAKRSAVSLVKV